MQLYRIAKAEYITDTTGAGARIYGGRWNRKGTAVIYTSESRALAVLESLVHVPLALAPRDLQICRIKIPGNIQPTEINVDELPPDWSANPPREITAEIGTSWAKEGKSLMLRVPSVVVRDEFNVLINPQHRDFSKVNLGAPEPLTFDERLIL